MLINFKLKTELSITWISHLQLEWLKEFLNAVSGKHGVAKDKHNFDDRSTNFEVVFNDCNETVYDDCNVYLYSDCVLGFSPKSFDLKVLLNPLEKYFDLPSIPIQECDVLGCKIKVVRVVSERSSKIRRKVNDSSNSDRVVLFVPLAIEANGLVPQYIVLSFKPILSCFNGIAWSKLLSYNKESPRLLNGDEPVKVKVASIKHIASKWLVCKLSNGNGK